jgi:hypothetical protein
MATKTKSQFMIYKQEIKKKKGIPSLIWSQVSSEGDELSVEKTVKKLKSQGVISIKVEDSVNGVNRLYNRLINSKNYTCSIMKVD